jgi:hypothetical protein
MFAQRLLMTVTATPARKVLALRPDRFGIPQ